jgi:hypothetical protein
MRIKNISFYSHIFTNFTAVKYRTLAGKTKSVFIGQNVNRQNVFLAINFKPFNEFVFRSVSLHPSKFKTVCRSGKTRDLRKTVSRYIYLWLYHYQPSVLGQCVSYLLYLCTILIYLYSVYYIYSFIECTQFCHCVECRSAICANVIVYF